MTAAWPPAVPTAALVLADGTAVLGRGAGAFGTAAGEVCFNTAMTGYQEILTDPSYAGQIVAFTFPHIGNVGANEEDIENLAPVDAHGVILRADITPPSNFRAAQHFDEWLRSRGIVGITGVDTRALTALIRKTGMPNAVLCHEPAGLDLPALRQQAAAVPSLAGRDLAAGASVADRAEWNQSVWTLGGGYADRSSEQLEFHVVAVDFGAKRNILRLLTAAGCKVTVVPADTKSSDILALEPDGVFLSNGPGDPAATAEYAARTIGAIIEADVPVFGICLGHQLLALALGCSTVKMRQGHHGANHPVRDNTTGRVEIAAMNHGFAVDRESLPENVIETHVSLFDGTNCGIRLDGRPVFSVQHHPEASPGPRDSHYLFRRFANLMREKRNMPLIDETGA